MVSHDSTVKWLGVMGDEAKQISEKVEKAETLHQAIAALDDPALDAC